MTRSNRCRRRARATWIACALCALCALIAGGENRAVTQDAAKPGAKRAADYPLPGERMSDAQVVSFARLALKGINREFPNKPSNVMVGPESVLRPAAMHPAFYGCYDWHSSVHGHWMLIRLLRLYPTVSIAAEIEKALDRNLTAPNLEKEAEYFRQKHNKTFERTYGWAWALKLAAELHDWDDARAKRWSKNFTPLEAVLVKRMKAYLPRLSWPIRTGEHPDTGFALSLTYDFARTVGDEALRALIVKRAEHYYGKDVDYPTRYEPSGQDFFSPGLNEADLMRRVLAPKAFGDWLDRFFPKLRAGDLGNLSEPATVSDLTDGKIVHLAGLNLTRGWTLRGVWSAIPADDPRRAFLAKLVKKHAAAGLDYVFSGHYEGEHWLASFAVYLLTDAGITAE